MYGMHIDIYQIYILNNLFLFTSAAVSKYFSFFKPLVERYCVLKNVYLSKGREVNRRIFNEISTTG